MTVPINKATPRAILLGVKDESIRAVDIGPEELPQHLPIMHILTEKAEDIAIVNGAAINQLYGPQTLNKNGPFFNHQSVMMQTILARGNQVMVNPIKLPGAKKATLRLSIETIATSIPTPSGGNRIVTRCIWHADRISAAITGNGVGQGEVLASYRTGTESSIIEGTMLSRLVKEDDQVVYSATSSLIPIMDLEVDARGDFGNRYGITLGAPTVAARFPTDRGLAESLSSFVYRLQFVERPSSGITPQVINNIYSENATDFVLKPHQTHPLSGNSVSLSDLIVENYQDSSDPTMIPRTAPFGHVYIYQDNIEAVSELIAGGYTVDAVDEAGATFAFQVPGVYGTTEQVKKNLYRINIFTGEDIDGRPYPNVDFDNSVKFGGILLGDNSVIYAEGGSDGIPYKNGAVDRMEVLRLYDEQVRNWCTYKFTENDAIFDEAKYPFNALHDSGFSMETKLALLQPMGRHKRIWVSLATHAVADYLDPKASEENKEFIVQKQLTTAEEISRATALRTAASVHPESEVYGTPIVRCIIVNHSGQLRNKYVTDFLPLTISVIDKVAAYCGAGSGVWNSDYAFDAGTNNRETMFTKVNNTYQNSSTYNKQWDAGMIWVQQYDRASLFFPAFQTAYPNDTSILNSLSTLIAVSYLERVCTMVWRELTGNNKFEEAEFIERSNELIIEYTTGRFDNRLTIVPETYFTKADTQRGYSWSTNIHMYGNTGKTVGTFTIVGHRMEDLRV